MKYPIIIIILISLFVSCEDNNESDIGFYDGNLVEEINFIQKTDSVKIFIEEFTYVDFSSDTIPYSYNQKNDDSDLIKLILYISYGSFDEKPKFKKGATFDIDSVYIWYSLFEQNNKALYKSNLITDVLSNPKYEYVKIDSIVIEKYKNKIVNIKTKTSYY